MKLTEYSEEEIKKLVNSGLCPVQALRDYTLLKQLQACGNVSKVADENNIARSTLQRIKKKYG